MRARELKVLILGEVPEVGDIFERRVFQDTLAASPIHVRNHENFEEFLQRQESYDLVLIDIKPYGIEVLEMVREVLPACPVVMVVDPDQAHYLLEAKQKGLEAYLIRSVDGELFTDLLALEIQTQLTHFLEPPKMESPSADLLYRYAQFHNVLEPLFVITRRRYLLYVNKAGQHLLEEINGTEPQFGDTIDEWVLEGTTQEFKKRLDQAFAGKELVAERHFPCLGSNDEGLRELHYQPVVDPRGRVVAVSIAVHQRAHPELHRARSMQYLTDLAAGISHQNNNLINILMANTELLTNHLMSQGDEEALRRLKKIEEAIERATRFTHQLQAFSQTSVSQPEAIDLSELIEGLQKSLRGDVDLVLDLEPDLPEIWADRDHWKTVVRNLVQHAARQLNDEDKLVLKTRSLQTTARDRSHPVAPGQYILFEVCYPGEEMTDLIQDRRFDPFFVQRHPHRRADLELATVKSIVEQGSGEIVVENKGGHNIYRIYYPTADLRSSREEETRRRGRR